MEKKSNAGMCRYLLILPFLWEKTRQSNQLKEENWLEWNYWIPGESTGGQGIGLEEEVWC